MAKTPLMALLAMVTLLFAATFATEAAWEQPIGAPGGLADGSEELLPQDTLLWCVAKASAQDAELQQLLTWACNNGADCEALQPGAPCFVPDTLYAHASFAANDYWQRRRANGATCDFNGAATLVTQDPSNGQCNYEAGTKTR